MAKNIIIGQSGCPTAVINSSLAGVYKAARSLGADKVYDMKYGIEGLLKEELLELNVLLDDRMSIDLLKRTPSSYLGSCRFKLLDPDTEQFFMRVAGLERPDPVTPALQTVRTQRAVGRHPAQLRPFDEDLVHHCRVALKHCPHH